MLWDDFLKIVLTVWGFIFGFTGLVYLVVRAYAKVKQNQFDYVDDDIDYDSGDQSESSGRPR